MGTNGTDITNNSSAIESASTPHTRPLPPKVVKESLVEPNLPPNLKKLVKTIESANDKHAAHRFVAAFFQGDEITRAGKRASELMANLLMECLPRFIATLHGTIVHAREIDKDNSTEPDLASVEVDGVSRSILRSGYLFIVLPRERVVVRARHEYIGGGESAHWLGVISNKDASAFAAAWEAFARQHAYLKNRAFYPDGTICISGRRYTWDDIVLPPKTLRAIRRHTEAFLSHRDSLRRAGVKLRRGLMLAGPPGTGKTLVCKVLAEHLNASLMWITPRYVTRVENFVEHLEVARYLAPTIVFLEDIDLYAEDRNTGCSSLLGELMGQLDGTTDNENLITVASTNRLEMVEQALRNRPGRFDRVIHIGALDEDCRRRLFARLLKTASIGDVDLAFLIAMTDGFTGAQAEELTNTIKMLGIEMDSSSDEPIRIDRSLIERALADIGSKPNQPIGFQ